MGLALELEKAGIPAIAIHTHVFARLAKSVATANGMPTARQAYVPQPLVDKSAADLRAYIEGIDPISKRPFMQEIIEGLTSALNDKFTWVKQRHEIMVLGQNVEWPCII